MYEEKRHLKLTSILYELKRAGLFEGERTVLRSVLREMGFRYKRINNKRHYFEQPQIIKQRHRYLRRVWRNRREMRPVVFLDETWANVHDGKDKAWIERDTVTGGYNWRGPSTLGHGSMADHSSCWVEGWLDSRL